MPLPSLKVRDLRWVEMARGENRQLRLNSSRYGTAESDHSLAG
jgi:hypothetical protein